jgi:hypothetical protein
MGKKTMIRLKVSDDFNVNIFDARILEKDFPKVIKQLKEKFK